MPCHARPSASHRYAVGYAVFRAYMGVATVYQWALHKGQARPALPLLAGVYLEPHIRE